MGNVILCHKTKAKNPYEISRIHKKLYTIEELCFYLIHNIYLVDSTIMNEQFCGWIGTELNMYRLEIVLQNALLEHCQREEFVAIILESSNMYSASELNYYHQLLTKVKDQKEVEQRKCKADNLLNNGEVEEAILVYQAILREPRETTVRDEFYGKIYACLGAAYGRAFLYKEAMEMYDNAFQICNDPMMVKSYLYAAKKVMEPTAYKLYLSKSEVFEELDEIIEKEVQGVTESLYFNPTDEMLERWKNNYRMGNMS